MRTTPDDRRRRRCVARAPAGDAARLEPGRRLTLLDTVWTPGPTDRHAEVLGKLLGLPGVHANLVPDAHLAALAIEHGLMLCSTDGDFARFHGLRWHNPLAA